MKEEKLAFLDSEGNTLIGVLNTPTENASETPIMILYHGHLTSKESRTYVQLQEGLEKVGIACFRFDFFAHGESEGNFQDFSLAKSIDGALSAYELLQAQGYQTIGLF